MYTQSYQRHLTYEDIMVAYCKNTSKANSTVGQYQNIYQKAAKENTILVL